MPIWCVNVQSHIMISIGDTICRLRCDIHGSTSGHKKYCSKTNKSSAVAEMGDRGHNRHWPKRGEGVLCPFRGALGTRLIQCGLRRCLLPYQVASSSIQPFGRNSVGCHSPHRNISTNYYLVVEMHTVTVRSDDARYLLN